jgi:hypothetical protein
MIHTHLNNDKAVPLWAALGAPLVGVPLMVALLAITAPAKPAAEVEAGADVEKIEVIEPAADVREDCGLQPLLNG